MKIIMTHDRASRFLCCCSALIAAATCITSALSPRSGSRPQLVQAADNQVTLSPEQTYALFGGSFVASYYDSSDGLYHALDLDYVGLSSAWVPAVDASDWQFFTIAPSSGNGAFFPDALRNVHDCLVYRGCVRNATSNNGQNNNNQSFNVRIPMSIDIPSTFEYSQKVFFGAADSSYNQTLSHVDVVGDGYSSSFHPAAGADNTYSYRGFTPLMGSGDLSQVPDSMRYLVHCFNISTGYQTNSFSISTLDFMINKVSWHYNSGEYNTGLIPNYDKPWEFYIFLETPTLYGYQPPQTTTVYTGSYTGQTVTLDTFPTVDLSNVESGMAIIIQQQQQQNYYERLQIEQLNTIIQQLDEIYKKMAQSGEIPVSLTPAAEYQRFGSDVMGNIDSLTTYTTARLPDSGNGATGVYSVMSALGLTSGVFFDLGIFSVAFTLICWVIFSGRGGN